MISINAADWIASADRRRESRVGAANPRTVSNELTRDFRDYPRGIKKCAVCAEPSLLKVMLDGKPYYCSSPVCKAARERMQYRTAGRHDRS